MNESKWYLRTQDETFGPETESKLIEWAKLGRIQPGQEVSDDNIEWHRVEEVPFLDMRFSIDVGDGNPRGPFNRAAAEALLASGRLPPTASIVEVRDPFPAEDEKSAPVETAAETSLNDAVKVVEKEVIKEVVKEVKVEVPVEKIVEKVVVDETRVKELEGLLAEERRHTAELQERLDASSRAAAEAAKAALDRENALKGDLANKDSEIAKFETAMKDAVDRENKYVEQVKSLEDELRRLPQAASEVADIQAAVYSIITGEADELGKVIEAEKQEFEIIKKRHAERMDNLQNRRHEMLKRSGSNIEDMTRKALISRPEDPRTVQLRKELEELRRVHDRAMLDNADQVKALKEQLMVKKAEDARNEESQKDITQLRQELQETREQLQLREKELLGERQRNEELNRQQATHQQALMARLASLESPSIGTASSMSTNQSREARQVKLPNWLRLK